MFNSIFGAIGQAAITGQGMYQSNAANQMNSGLAQQQLGQMYNAAMMQNKPRWMIDGVAYPNAQAFAQAMFPGDDEARLMFTLKYGDE